MLLEENLVEVEKIEMYGVLCIDKNSPEGSICRVKAKDNPNDDYYSDTWLPATKKKCKEFIKKYSKIFPESKYKIFKMKFKEKK